MPLTSSGAISLNEMHIEAGGTSASEASINDADIIGMISKTAGTAMSFNEWYGASSGYTANERGFSTILPARNGQTNYMEFYDVNYTATFADGNGMRSWLSSNYHDVAAGSCVVDMSSSTSTSPIGNSTATADMVVSGANYNYVGHFNNGKYGVVAADGTVQYWCTVAGLSASNSKNIGRNAARSGAGSSNGVILSFDRYFGELDNTTMSWNWCYQAASGYENILMPYSDTHMQVCSFNGGTFYNSLIRKSDGQLSSQTYLSTGGLVTHGFRTKYGAWAFEAVHDGPNAKREGWAVGMRHASGGVYKGYFNVQTNTFPDYAEGVLHFITESGRIVTGAGQVSDGLSTGYGAYPSAAVSTNNSNGTLGTEWGMYMSFKRGHTGGSLYGGAQPIMTTSFSSTADDSFTMSNTALMYSAGGLQHYCAGVFEFKGNSAPTAGTYNGMQIIREDNFYVDDKTGAPMRFVTGEVGSASFLTQTLGSANPASNSSSHFTSSAPTLTSSSAPSGFSSQGHGSSNALHSGW